MGFIKFTQIRWCRGAIAEGAAPTLALALWKRPMLVGWHEPTECMTLGKFTGSALRNNKNVISDVFGSGNHLPTTQLSWAWMEPRRPNVELEVPWQLMFMGRSPGEHPRMPIRPCWRYDKGIMVVRLPQKKKKTSSTAVKIEQFPSHPFPSSHQWSFKILLGNQATPLPPNCLPLILHLANGKIQTSHEKMVPASYVLTTCKVHFQRTKINPSK